MATSSPVLVYPGKSAKEILMDEINIKNGTNLVSNDFDFSSPVSVIVPNSTVNTKITITPKETTLFYGSKDIFYKRLDLGVILATPEGLVVPGNSTLLSQIIPNINSVFGIGLRTEDYNEQSLPIYGSVNSGIIPRVIVQAKNTSLLFIGQCSLALGPVTPDSAVLDPALRYYLHMSGYTDVDYSKMIVCFDSKGVIDTSFSFLQNTTSVTTVNILRSILLNNGNLVLNGLFILSIFNSGDVSPLAVNCQSITIRPDGSIASYSSTFLFNSNHNVFYTRNTNVPFIYTVDSANNTRVNKIYRYNQVGVLDSTYISALSYVPVTMALSSDGLLYTASSVYDIIINSVLTKQVRIDRLLENGSIDTTFTPVIITGEGVDFPLPVVQIAPITNNGFWILLQPLLGTSVSGSPPVINGVQLVPSGITTAMSFNPIVRFAQSGLMIPTFKSLLKDNLENSIFTFVGSGLNIGTRPLFVTDTAAGFLTYKDNPVTGFTHRQPISFNAIGDVRLLSGPAYFDQYRWISAPNVTIQPDNKFSVHGTLQLKELTGGWGTTVNALGQYNSDGSISRILYSVSLTDTLNNPLSIRSVHLRVLP